MSYGDGPGWRDAAARSLDAMYERALKAEAERDRLSAVIAEALDYLRHDEPDAAAVVLGSLTLTDPAVTRLSSPPQSPR
jgi:hypothetical protein